MLKCHEGNLCPEVKLPTGKRTQIFYTTSSLFNTEKKIVTSLQVNVENMGEKNIQIIGEIENENFKQDADLADTFNNIP